MLKRWIQMKHKWVRQIKVMTCVLSFYLWPSVAFASSGVSTIESGLRALVDMMSGTTATLIAVAAVIGVGYAWLVKQKINMQQAGITALSIGVVFGAFDIVAALGGGTAV